MKVNWNENKCQHAGVCVKSLPEVFKVEDGAFVIDPSATTEVKLKDTISKCPSAALSIEE